MKEFDYYIYIDYSENLMGYTIIERSKIREFIEKISKFGHYNELKHKSSYLKSIKRVIEKNNIFSYILKNKIRKRSQNIEIYTDVLEFLKLHENCIIFISVDNHEYPNFKKLVNVKYRVSRSVNPNNRIILTEHGVRQGLFLYNKYT